MSGRFHPMSMEQLTDWVFGELEQKKSVFGIPRELFWVPDGGGRMASRHHGRALGNPFGVAAGPHTQMAQNIVVAWLCGARLIELKTVQTLDLLEVDKPCIDMQEEGYNVEWSQELRVHESFDEYLRAWVLIHALHRRLGFPGDDPGVVFDMSVGYDLAGIRSPNVQWYLDAMSDASPYKERYQAIVAARCPEVAAADIPNRLVDSVTLSTMHGCPPDEIGQIASYLLENRGLHTSVKCNPTLLGAKRVRSILAGLGYLDVVVPDSAFGHDLAWSSAVPLFEGLRDRASECGLEFGLKLSNTLEVLNHREVFTGSTEMYLSGRPLHAVTTNLALDLVEQFGGRMPLSFAGGADCFSGPHLLRSGLGSITVCSDLLKSGGYLRLPQYLETTAAAMDEAGASSLDDFVCRTAVLQGSFSKFSSMFAASGGGFSPSAGQRGRLSERVGRAGEEGGVSGVASWAAEQGYSGTGADAVVAAALKALGWVNLLGYATAVRSEGRLHKQAVETGHSKTRRPLGLFDCIEAPCVDECPVDQDVPCYMAAVREGRFADAVAITRLDNPIPAVLGHVCDHLCERACIRTHYDEPLAIREIKRFIMAQETGQAAIGPMPSEDRMVAVVGAGPAGIAAAEWLARAGIAVTVFEARRYPGGMVGGAIPAYRLPQDRIDRDVEIVEGLGVHFEYGVKAGIDFTLSGLRRQGFAEIVVAVGAQSGKHLGIEGEDAGGVLDGVGFLRSVREGNPLPIGRRVAVVGGGDTAMDCARTARRLGAEVTVLYRRTIGQMPADREEVQALLEEGIAVEELAAPVRLGVEGGSLRGITCTRMEHAGERDASGRKGVRPVPGSEFDMPFDTMLTAISQHPVLDFFDFGLPRLTEQGCLATDPETLQTSLEGVYAAGDASGHGPASIVVAAADGKRVAGSIIGRRDRRPSYRPPSNLVDLVARRSKRRYRVPVRHTGIDARGGFEQTVVTYTAEEARAEAQRCLDCDRMCGICVSVCPNLAIFSYAVGPLAISVPKVRVRAGVIEVAAETETFRVGQDLQVAVLGDFCNECGNCATFCPTAGRPYRDKPRLYLDRSAFEDETDNAFMLVGGADRRVMEARRDGATHRVTLSGDLAYSSPAFTARIDPSSWTILEGAPGPGVQDGPISLELCAAMYSLLAGIRGSMAHLPAGVPERHHGGGRIEDPEYSG
jgi:putative selenate reductase